MAAHDIQLALLAQTSLPTPTSSSPTTVHTFTNAIIAADFASVLTSPHARFVFSRGQDARIQDLFEAAGMHGGGGGGVEVECPEELEPEQETAALVRFLIAIACLQAFIQINWTGPSLGFALREIFPTGTLPPSSSTPVDDAAAQSSGDDDDLHNATIPLLALGGEPAYHLAQYPTLLLLAIRLLHSLETPSAQQQQQQQQLETLPIWLLRASRVHQSILDEPVGYPEHLLPAVQALLSASDSEAEAETSTSTLKLSQDLRASIMIEVGLAYHLTGQDKTAGGQFLRAAREHGLEYELTGAMGKRTRFQVKDLSQLVLLARSRSGLEAQQGAETSEGKDTAAESSTTEGEGTGTGTGTGAATTAPGMPETLALNDDTLLEQTEFTSSSISTAPGQSLPARLASLNPADQPALDPLDQCLLIDMCLAQHNTTPENGLTASQMAPYLTRVLSHPRNWSVHTTALLLRARLEAKRSRTVERSALQLQALVDQMPTADSEASERLKYFYQLPLPSKWEMERELAQRFLSLGVVRSALEIFTRLEMWEEAVRCYANMERGDLAVEIVHELLEGKKAEMDIVTARFKAEASVNNVGTTAPAARRSRIDRAREAKLWCVLGDLVPEKAEEYYEKAWQVSGETSSRSQRSLGGIYLTKDNFAAAIPKFQAALKINPLYARTWFSLGCCYVREERWNDAREAFSRNVAIEEEDAEAWNNLAAVYLRMDELAVQKATSAAAGVEAPQEEEDAEEVDKVAAVPFENKRLAFRALQQGLRFSRDNWRVWTNYMIVAVDVGELSEAARALSRIVSGRTGKDVSTAIDLAVLSKLVDAVTREDWNNGKGSLAEGQPRTSNEGLGLLPMVERLFNEVILPRVSDSPRIYAIQARLFRWKEDWSGALDAYLKAYRGGIAQDEQVERDLPRFKEAVEDLEELVDLMRMLGPRAKEQEAAQGLEKGKAKWNDWKFQARTLVRTFVGRTRDSFGDQPDFDRLKELLDDLRN
ncbi:hypothetical protein NliqN6_2669 [Naganishia liquefaciens]|uniref:Tetratricopeptide repeat protein n=1 Tax=Naganishia liquefaciens TaxID=104408 RepID=A0A8H3TS90_9TREE|nr:hypothetical protein NliqN6_2669 [Naganishia liquefaciens]